MSKGPRASTPDRALGRLLEGSRRPGRPVRYSLAPDRRDEVAAAQKPWAAILGCVDSRVPPELIFGWGIGDLFVVRTAGQALAAPVVGSIELAVALFDVPLLVVLGHQRCGAVMTTIEALERGEAAPGSIGAVVEAIAPAVEAVRGRPGDRVDNAVRENIRVGVQTLRSSPVLGEAADRGALRIVGAYYSLDADSVELVVR